MLKALSSLAGERRDKVIKGLAVELDSRASETPPMQLESGVSAAQAASWMPSMSRQRLRLRGVKQRTATAANFATPAKMDPCFAPRAILAAPPTVLSCGSNAETAGDAMPAAQNSSPGNRRMGTSPRRKPASNRRRRNWRRRS
ncbi:hypothetical protein F6P96_01745 [Escherichia coli]|nr:hypothetical protein F6P96_01745 [Escherichia coli]